MNIKITLKSRIGAALALLASAAIALSACTSAAPDASTDQNISDSAILTQYQLNQHDAKTLLTTLDEIPVSERPEGLGTSIKVDALELSTAGGKTETIALPKDEFYLSFAPYLNQTHDCFFHNPTGCIGELGNENFQVKIVDTGSNKVLIDETITSFDNGFIGVWLPRNIEAELSVSHPDGSATTTIATGAEDPTCLTTLRLQ